MWPAQWIVHKEKKVGFIFYYTAIKVSLISVILKPIMYLKSRSSGLWCHHLDLNFHCCRTSNPPSCVCFLCQKLHEVFHAVSRIISIWRVTEVESCLLKNGGSWIFLNVSQVGWDGVSMKFCFVQATEEQFSQIQYKSLPFNCMMMCWSRNYPTPPTPFQRQYHE